MQEFLMYKLFFNVPVTHVDIVKNAIFAAGAGVIGNYSHCAWEVLGEGQFMPLAGSNAFIGEINKLEKVAEYKVETVCADDCIHDVIVALKEAHPYESPGYDVFKLEDF
jgi:structural hemagglutinin/hemolysin toxin protein RtxA